MMTVLERSELDASPLADLHAIADQIGLDGFRRLRKADLIDAILERSGGGVAGEESAGDGDGESAGDGDGDGGRRARGGRASGGRSGRGRIGGEPTGTGGRGGVEGEGAGEEDSSREGAGEEGSGEERAPRTARRRRPTRSRRARGAADDREHESEGATTHEEEPPTKKVARGQAPRAAEDRVAEGIVELLGNGSAFLRVSPPEASDEDVYISAAQVRRCELVSGDRVSGPVRTPRQSERYPSLARVDTINGAPADSVAEGTRYEDFAVAYPSERLELDPQDPTLGAIEWLTPIGRGSRATIVGEARSGKTETLRRLLGALVGREGLEVMLVLGGVRPEEIAVWREGPVAPAAALDLGASAELQGQTVEHVVDTAKRIAARGGHVVVLIDTLDHLAPHTARRILAGARNLVEGGSLTLIATAVRPLGGESTVIALDVELTSTGRIPALDLAASGVVRPELLVGEDGAAAITKARASALAG
jgi:transcription termination factor Rho